MTEPVNEQIIQTTGEPAVMSPVTRIVRTALQLVVALIAVIPTAAALFDVSAATAAKFVGYMSGVALLVSTLHNAWNASQTTK